MSRVLVVGDVHASDQSPSKRDEHYCEDILRKLREIVSIALAENTDYVIFHGDIFHQKKPRMITHRLVLSLIDIFSSFHCPVFIVVGNHDITSGSLQSLYKQPLSVLSACPNVTLLGTQEDENGWGRHVLSGTHKDIVLYPIPGVPNVTVDDYAVGAEEGKWSIVVAHQSVVPDIKKEMTELQTKPFIHDSAAIAEVTSADIILYGHQHRCDGIYRRGGKLFVNLGSICRLTIGKEDLNKEPSVFLLELTDKAGGKIIPLQYVRPADECYMLAQHYETKAHKQDIIDAVSQLKSSTLDSFSVESVLHDINLRDDVSVGAKNEAIQLLEGVL